MPDSNKFTDRAAALANQAADAAGPLITRAKAVAEDLAEKASPYVSQAAGYASQGVSVAAAQVDKATSGKYSDKISSVTSKIDGTLGKAKQDKPYKQGGVDGLDGVDEPGDLG